MDTSNLPSMPSASPFGVPEGVTPASFTPASSVDSLPSDEHVHARYPAFRPAKPRSPTQTDEGVSPASSVASLPSDEHVHARFPAFKPAPSAAPTHSAVKEEMPVPRKVGSRSRAILVNNFLTVVGASLIFLLALTPMWNAYGLLQSSSFVFFMGRSKCFVIIVVCVAIVFFFTLVMLLLERFGHVEIKTDATVMYLFTSTITALGLFLLFMSLPLDSEAKVVTDNLMYSCGTGAQTQLLFAYYNVLLKMRLKQDCKDLASIELCPGYQEQAPYTAFLKEMELNYQCSGFCYKSNSTSATMTVASLLQEFADTDMTNDVIGLLQGHVKQVTVQARGVGDPEVGIVVHAKHGQNHLDRNKLLSLLSSNRSFPAIAGADAPWNQAKQGYGDTIHNMEVTRWMDAYPRTLFTNANYKVTCEGAIVREFQFGVKDRAQLMYMEGVGLLVASILVGFMKIFVMCKTASRDANLCSKASDASSKVSETRPKNVVL